MRGIRIIAFCFLLLLVHTGCSPKEPSADLAPKFRVRPQWKLDGESFLVDRVGLGFTQEQVILFLGEPNLLREAAESRKVNTDGLPARILNYHDEGASVQQSVTLVPREGKFVVIQVQGDTLYQGDKLLVSKGDSPEAVITALGQPSGGQDSFPPTNYTYPTDNLFVFFARDGDTVSVDSVKIFER